MGGAGGGVAGAGVGVAGAGVGAAGAGVGVGAGVAQPTSPATMVSKVSTAKIRLPILPPP